MGEPYLSVIFPAYNEAERLAKTLPRVLDFLRSQKYESEILLVDDGSQDQTVTTAEALLKGFPHKVLRQPRNRGKGAAVKRGMLAGMGRFLLFSDADLSTPIEEVEGFLKELESGYQVVIGSRAMQTSDILERQPFWREWMGRIFNFCARTLAFRNIRDSQCGFKAFSQKAAQDLFSRQKLERFSFDVEVIYLAQKLGYRILEKPVAWRNSAQSKVSVLRDSLNMFLDLLRIRWMHRG